MEENYQGARDTQTDTQKSKNYKQGEFVTSPTIPLWIEKPQSSWKSTVVRNQNGSGTCVAQTYATELGIIFQQKYNSWVDFSASYPYQQRKYPNIAGCTSEDIYSVFPKIGDVFERDMPSQLFTDSQVMSVKKESYYEDIARTFKIARVSLAIDFETIASTIQATGKGVMVWFRFSTPEWLNIPIILSQPTTSAHSVTAVDFTLKNGKKYLVIQDSWGLQYAMNGLRLISEEYFNTRCFVAGYLMNFVVQDNTIIQRPQFTGTIISAQKCFKWEGVFPSNVDEVESWGNITRTACIAFQKRYGITPAYGNFGPATKTKLFELFP